MGTKGCYLGEIDEQTKKTSIEFKQTSPIIWQAVEINLEGEIDKAGLQTKIIEVLNQIKQKTYFSLTIKGAQYLTEEERELTADTDFGRQSRKICHLLLS